MKSAYADPHCFFLWLKFLHEQAGMSIFIPKIVASYMKVELFFLRGSKYLFLVDSLKKTSFDLYT
eukprot:snap_masked-scaffold_12-processed-gene-4.24-mRNA-1 protein AED:1.00 eAED:1.00 QI:0/0/0/0/1/1/2/0/64